MAIKINSSQSRRINNLIKRLCCNCVNGNCLLLDDGDEHSCVQLISKYGIYCNYFIAAVLPASKELYAEVMNNTKGKKCSICKSEFTPKAKNQRYCPKCAERQKRLKATERQRKKRALKSRF